MTELAPDVQASAQHAPALLALPFELFDAVLLDLGRLERRNLAATNSTAFEKVSSHVRLVSTAKNVRRYGPAREVLIRDEAFGRRTNVHYHSAYEDKTPHSLVTILGHQFQESEDLSTALHIARGAGDGKGVRRLEIIGCPFTTMELAQKLRKLFPALQALFLFECSQLDFAWAIDDATQYRLEGGFLCDDRPRIEVDFCGPKCDGQLSSARGRALAVAQWIFEARDKYSPRYTILGNRPAVRRRALWYLNNASNPEPYPPIEAYRVFDRADGEQDFTLKDLDAFISDRGYAFLDFIKRLGQVYFGVKLKMEYDSYFRDHELERHYECFGCEGVHQNVDEVLVPDKHWGIFMSEEVRESDEEGWDGDISSEEYGEWYPVCYMYAAKRAAERERRNVDEEEVIGRVLDASRHGSASSPQEQEVDDLAHRLSEAI